MAIDVQQLLILAQTHKRNGDFGRAESIYHELIKFQPNNNAFHYNLAKVYYLTKDYGLSVSNYLIAMALEAGFAISQLLGLKVSPQNPAAVSGVKFLQSLPSWHSQSYQFLQHDHNTATNLGHVLYEMSNSTDFPKVPKYKEYEYHYRQGLLGKERPLFNQNFEMNLALFAVAFGMENIDWDSIFEIAPDKYSNMDQLQWLLPSKDLINSVINL